MARRSGALQRVRDFPNAEALLRVLLLHVANGCSLAETATRARELGIEVSAVAVFKRLRASEQWLRWLAEQVRSGPRQALESQGRPVRAVDGTSVSEPGSTGTDWRVHYVVNLANLQCDFFELTGVREGGETLRRVPIQPGDIMMGDRVYASPVGVAHVIKAHADLVVRLNRQALPLFDGRQGRVNVLRLCRPLKVGQVQQWTTQVRPSPGRLDPRPFDRPAAKPASHAHRTTPPGASGLQESAPGQCRSVGSGPVFFPLDHAARHLFCSGRAGALSVAVADRTGDQAHAIHCGVGPSTQERPHQCTGVASWQTVHQPARGAVGTCRQLIFPLGIPIGCRCGEAAGGKRNSCFANSAWRACRSIACLLPSVTGMTSWNSWPNHRAGGIATASLKLTLMGRRPRNARPSTPDPAGVD